MPSNPATNVDVNRFFAAFLTTYEGPIGGLWFKDTMKVFESDAITDIMPGGRVTSGLQPFGYGNCRTDKFPSTFRYQITKNPFADQVSLNRQEWEADKLGIFNNLVETMGVKAQQDWNRKAVVLIAANGLCYDGSAFFGPHSLGVDVNGVAVQIASNGVMIPNPAAGAAVTYSNVATVGGTNSTLTLPQARVAAANNVPTDVEAANIIAEAIGLMVAQPDYSGDPLNAAMQAMTIVTPDALKFAAFNSAVTKLILSGTQSNPVTGFTNDGWRIKVVLAPLVASANGVIPGSAAGTVATAAALANTVTFFRSDAQVPALIGTEAPDGVVPSFQGIGSDYTEACDKVRFNIRVDRGYGYGEPSAALQVVLSH